MTEKKTPVRKKAVRSKPVNAVSFSVWAVNGGPLPEEVVVKIESAMETVVFEAFNDGYRLLTQTSKG